VGVLCFTFCWKKYGKAVQHVSSLPPKVRWYFEIWRIRFELGWVNDEGLLYKDVTHVKKYTDRLRKLLVNHLDGSNINISCVYAIVNKTLISKFVEQRKVLMARHTNSVKVFEKHDWRNIPQRKVLREWVDEVLTRVVNSYAWNADQELPVVAVIYGTDENIGWHICTAGFGSLSSLDLGFYGKGIYFTSSCMYALPYYADKRYPAFLVSLVTPGNSRPIVEAPKEANSFLGVSIDPGYQSHFILTNKGGLPCTLREDYFYELVIDEVNLIVPIFLVTVPRSTALDLLLKGYTREIVVSPDQEAAELEFKEDSEEEEEVASTKTRAIGADEYLKF